MRRTICFIWALAATMAASAADYTVGDAATLKTVAQTVNASADSRDVAITLTADIDLAGVQWEPIGTTTHPFTGTFHGQGHTLSNVNVAVDYTATGGVAGLFGQIGQGGVVSDVHVRGGQIAVSTNNDGKTCQLGGIAGANAGTVVGCSSTAKVTGYAWPARIGGIVGENLTGGSVQNCYCLGPVYTSKSDNYIGGIVGNNLGSLQNCFMRSEVQRLVNGKTVASAYPLYGNSYGGTCTGCFYANGLDSHTTQPMSIGNLSDNSLLIADNSGVVGNVLLDGRTLYTDGDWNTLCLPFSIPAGTVQGYSPIAGAVVMTLDETTFAKGTLTLNFKTVESIEAGKPYIVKWSQPIADNIANPVFMNVTISDGVEPKETDFAFFYGSTSYVSIQGEDLTKLFLGAANTMYYPTQAMTIGACRAYFQLKDLELSPTPGQARADLHFAMSFDGQQATAIRPVADPTQAKRGATQARYSLDGRRVLQPTPGRIYIQNGKKMVAAGH